jgi:hypothetical protein
MEDATVAPPAERRLSPWRILAVAGVWEVLGLVAWAISPASHFLNIALCGSLLLIFAEPDLARAGRTLLLGAGFGLVWGIAHRGDLGALPTHPATLGALLGLGALADLVLHPPQDGSVSLAAFGIPGIVLVAVPVILSIRGPMTQDAVLLEADRALGGLSSYAVAGVFGTWPALAALSRLAYVSLPVEVAVVALVAIRSALPTMRPGRIMLVCLLTGFVGAALYRICPATGPVYAFPGFPSERPGALPLAAMQVPPAFPRNAIPSLHFAWAWIVWRAARPVRWLRWATLLWLVGISIAALGFGEHYLIDLIVAVPFVTTLEALVAPARWYRPLAGALVTLAWLVYLGTSGRLSPAVGWVAVIATLAIGLWVAPRRPYAAPALAGEAA